VLACNSIEEFDSARQAYWAAHGRGQHHHRALRGLGARWTPAAMPVLDQPHTPTAGLAIAATPTRKPRSPVADHTAASGSPQRTPGSSACPPNGPTAAAMLVSGLGVWWAHVLRTDLAQVPKGSAGIVAAAIRTIFAQRDALHACDHSTSSPTCSVAKPQGGDASPLRCG